MQSSSSSWVGYGKLAVNAHSAPKMAIGETTQMWQILFVVSFFFCFLLSPLVSDCQSVYSTRLVLAKISHGLCTTQPVRSKRHSNEDADGCGKHFDDCFFNQFYVCWFQIIE